MSTNDVESYLDHAHLTAADFTEFEQLIAASPDQRPALHADWHLVLTSTRHTGAQWESTYALFRPCDARAAAEPGNETYVRVYFDEDGRALPDQPHRPVPVPPLAAELAEHLPGWFVQPCPLNPGRDLVELSERLWGGGPAPWGSVSAPHTALSLAGPGGERLLAVRPRPGDELVVRAVRPDDAPDYRLDDVKPPVCIVFPTDAAPATVAAEVRDRFAPGYREAAWRARTNSFTFAAEALQRLSTAYIPEPGSPWGHHGEIGAFESEADRNRAAWRYITTLTEQGPHLAAGIRAATVIEDRLDPVVGPDLRRFYVTEAALASLQEIQDGWHGAMGAIVGTSPEAERTRDRAEDLRNQEAWECAAPITDGPLPALAAHVTPRIGLPTPNCEEQVKAALARSGHLRGQSTPAPAPPAPPRPDARRPAR
ncbi:hypothetical protein P3T27_005915 [Kitasatospora sp. MAA19]|uniref:hypothetical protein n=1 Tax=unclassified Kitasatospora TaxID=2633591 RepID=UPI002476E29C|nr:hypothetical protein [Kitasatospora sp. MAA19]MDH6709169.1 hypothetical protein [Kitasatospora sp. MAA19]